MFSLSRLFVQGKYQRLFMHFHPTPRKAMTKMVGGLSRNKMQKDMLILYLCWLFGGDSKGGDVDFQGRLQNGGWDVGRELGTLTGGVQAPHTAYHPSLWSLFMFMFIFLPSPPHPELFSGKTCLSFYMSKKWSNSSNFQ